MKPESFKVEIMLEHEWLHSLGEIVSKQSLSKTDYESLRDYLVRFYLLALDAPYHIGVWYDAVEEEALSTAQDRWIEILNDDGAPSQIVPTAPPKTLMTEIGGLLRACDYLLSSDSSHWGREADTEDWIVGDWFLVPRNAVPHWRVAAKSQSIRRRGMVFHRLVPRNIRGLNVKLLQFATMSDRPDERRLSLGAAMLTNLQVKFTPPNGISFHAVGLNEIDHERLVLEQLKSGAEEDCFCIVWPELTMPPRLSGLIENTLANAALTGERLAFPDIVVAGSWHELVDGEMRNVAQIYDRFGKKHVAYSKIVPYFDQEYGDEAIKSGNELTLLVTDEFLVGFGICKDFCGFSNPPLPLLDLNADIVVVPSMGDDKTLAAHRKVADFLRIQSGGRAFVVQHSHPTTNDNIVGYVIPPEAQREDEPVAIPDDGGLRIFNRQ